MIDMIFSSIKDYYVSMMSQERVVMGLQFIQDHNLLSISFIGILGLLGLFLLRKCQRLKKSLGDYRVISLTTSLKLGRIEISRYVRLIQNINLLFSKTSQLCLSIAQYVLVFGFVRLIYHYYPILNSLVSIRYVFIVLVNFFVWSHYLIFHFWMRKNKSLILKAIHKEKFDYLKWQFLKYLAKYVLSFGVSLIQFLIITPVISLYLAYLQTNVAALSDMALTDRVNGVYIFVALRVFWTSLRAIYVDMMKGSHRFARYIAEDVRVHRIAVIRKDQVEWFVHSAIKGFWDVLLFISMLRLVEYATSLLFTQMLPTILQVAFHLVFNIGAIYFLWKGYSWLTQGLAHLPKKDALFSRILKRVLGIESSSPFNAVNFQPFIKGGIQSVRVVTTLLFVSVSFAVLLRVFPKTQGVSSVVFGYILNPLLSVWKSFLMFVPNIIIIAVIVVITNYIMDFARFFFEQIERENLKFTSFHKDVAMPTYKIVRFLIFVFSIILIFPYLPGANSPAFKGISVVLGVLFSFGSSTFVTNVIAGVMLTYMRPFKIGDRVRIADTVGDVVEKNMLVTRIRTIKNIHVAVPNALILGAHITNFSFMAKDVPVILHTTITIGYDVPWKTVHDLMISAARKTPGILQTPEPFVLQTKLLDFYVEYEINAYTMDVKSMASLYSMLHENIQLEFNAANVEITSPHFRMLRDDKEIN